MLTPSTRAKASVSLRPSSSMVSSPEEEDRAEAAKFENPAKGKDALLKMGSRGGLRHFTANLVVTPTPEGAKGSVYLLLFNARNIPATIVETAIYDDTLVKTPQGWRFKKRVVWRDDDDISPFKPKPLP
jgi:hypothetical protein